MNKYISLLFIKFKENRKITSAPCQQWFCYISNTRVALRACSVNTWFSRAPFFFFFLFKPPNTSQSGPAEGTRSWLEFLREKATSVVVATVLRTLDVMGYCLYCTVLLVSAEARATTLHLSAWSPSCHQACQLLPLSIRGHPGGHRLAVG